MRSFADLIEVTVPAASTDAARNLTTVASVKAALLIADTGSDAAIAGLIPRASKLIVEECGLAGAAGQVPTFARETLRATWYACQSCRGCEIWLPWRPPFASMTSVAECGVTLVAVDDFVVMGDGRSVRLQRMSGGVPREWSPGKIEVVWQAGFASVMSDTVDKDLEAACIDQVKAMLMGADRDPAIRSESSPDIGAVSYSQAGGDTFKGVLLPQVADALGPWRSPLT